MTGKVRVAVVGAGNCASALVQGVAYYRDADPDARARVAGYVIAVRDQHTGPMDDVFEPTADAAAATGPLAGRPWLASYAPGVPADVDLPTDSLPQLLSASAARYRSRARSTAPSQSA